MQRREFITLLGSAAVAWPLAARAQQPAMPVIGFLRSTSANASANLVAAFRRGLTEAGYIEGQNIAVEYRWAEYRDERLPGLAADLVRRQCAVIIAGGNGAALAVKAATATIPIVFSTGDDPIELGLVASLNRPEGNVTGIFFYAGVLESKQLELLREAVPKATVIGVLVNPTSPASVVQARDAQAAARALGQQVYIVNAGSERDIDPAFATLVQHQVGGILVSGNALFTGQRNRLAALAAHHALPAMYFGREFVEAGGLMSYGASITDAYRQVGNYAGRILKGTKPADLPVQAPTKFELVVNVKTAKALGLTIPESFLLRADEVIE
jgi:putative tryptophan/tyrosine transport system substrate-binding protein